MMPAECSAAWYPWKRSAEGVEPSGPPIQAILRWRSLMTCSVAERPPAQLVEPMLTTRESVVSIGSIRVWAGLCAR
ncbi:hypothetical protein [Streptomyces sp. NBC_00647]|uniref:hypothetical protein n=1 Tax=Streptomyces sp. NBC_00647 TaxID=2975796 RepID=UPI0038677E41